MYPPNKSSNFRVFFVFLFSVNTLCYIVVDLDNVPINAKCRYAVDTDPI